MLFPLESKPAAGNSHSFANANAVRFSRSAYGACDLAGPLSASGVETPSQQKSPGYVKDLKKHGKTWWRDATTQGRTIFPTMAVAAFPFARNGGCLLRRLCSGLLRPATTVHCNLIAKTTLAATAQTTAAGSLESKTATTSGPTFEFRRLEKRKRLRNGQAMRGAWFHTARYASDCAGGGQSLTRSRNPPMHGL